ncbi:hypothetical protein THOM_1809 [Trachipleistophora hominis]|uniref:Uncharacterized protein n=1 Tax=Trachipleistophora hominis TaxID=72359 RepID=L7JW36_TRAHO|nr:hypothetical protein THOM_1809 [Trachipleistophora hominis]
MRFTLSNVLVLLGLWVAEAYCAEVIVKIKKQGTEGAGIGTEEQQAKARTIVDNWKELLKESSDALIRQEDSLGKTDKAHYLREGSGEYAVEYAIVLAGLTPNNVFKAFCDRHAGTKVAGRAVFESVLPDPGEGGEEFSIKKDNFIELLKSSIVFTNLLCVPLAGSGIEKTGDERSRYIDWGRTVNIENAFKELTSSVGTNGSIEVSVPAEVYEGFVAAQKAWIESEKRIYTKLTVTPVSAGTKTKKDEILAVLSKETAGFSDKDLLKAMGLNAAEPEGEDQDGVKPFPPRPQGYAAAVPKVAWYISTASAAPKDGAAGKKKEASKSEEKKEASKSEEKKGDGKSGDTEEGWFKKNRKPLFIVGIGLLALVVIAIIVVIVIRMKN